MNKEILNLLVDIGRITRGNPILALILVFQRAFWVIFIYRMERLGFNLFGEYYKYVRILLLPVLLFFNVVHNCEIHYLARSGPGSNWVGNPAKPIKR